MTSKARKKAGAKQARDYQKNVKKTKSFAEKLKNAGTEMSSISQAEKQAFYQRTKNFWINAKNPEDRNKMIIKALDVKNLEEAFNLIMNDEEMKNINFVDFGEEVSGTPAIVRRVTPLGGLSQPRYGL